MQIIIEGYQYPAGSVNKVLWEGAFQTVDGKVSIGDIGGTDPSGGVRVVE